MNDSREERPIAVSTWRREHVNCGAGCVEALVLTSVHFDNGRRLHGPRLWNGLPMTLLDASARRERCVGVGGVENIHAMNNRN